MDLTVMESSKQVNGNKYFWNAAVCTAIQKHKQGRIDDAIADLESLMVK